MRISSQERIGKKGKRENNEQDRTNPYNGPGSPSVQDHYQRILDDGTINSFSEGQEEEAESLQTQAGDIIVASLALGEGDGGWRRCGRHAIDED